MNKLLFLSLLLFMCFSKVNSQSILNFNYVATLHSHENHNTVFSAKFTNGTVVMDTGYAEFFLNPPTFAAYQYLGNYYVLASFNRIPEDSDITRMNGLGIHLLNYIPQQTYFVSIPSAVSFTDVNLLVNTTDFWFKAIDSLPTAYRIDASVSDYKNNVTPNTTPVIIAISLFDNVNNTQKINDLNLTGASLLTLNDSIHTLFAMMNASSITAVSAMPWVQYMSVFAPPAFQSQVPDTSINEGIQPLIENYYHNNILLTGNAVNVYSYESYQPYLFHHIDNANNILNWNTNPFALTDGFQVPACGVIGGNGISNPKFKGLAPNASIYALDNTQLTWYYSVPPTTADFNDFLYAATDFQVIGDLMVTNVNPQLCGSGSQYSIMSEIADYLLLQAPHVVCANSIGTQCNTIGYGTITNQNAAPKNTLSFGSFDFTRLKLAPNSPWGPLFDGRMKPDLLSKTGIMAPTVDLNNLSAKNLMDNFSIPACPTSVGAGTAALLHEAIITNSKYGKGMTIKAAMLNSAFDVENTGPDYKSGYGVLDIFSAVNCVSNSYIAEVGQGDISVYTFTLNKPAYKCKVLLYWNDDEGGIAATLNLINDLDLWVEDPHGNKIKPFTLNPFYPSNSAVRDEDHINNSEQVSLDSVPAGTYKIFVRGTDLRHTVLFAVNVDLREKCIQLTTPIANEKVQTKATGKPYRIHWINNIDAKNGSSLKIRVLLSTKYTTHKYNNCSPTRQLDESWQTIVTNLPITTTDYDFDFLKYTGNNHDCAILYNNYYKVKVEIYSNSNVFCSDESAYFSIINPPQNVALDSLNCIKHITWDNDFTNDLGFLADGYHIYRSNINSPNNWTKVGKTYVPIWQTQNEPPGEYYYCVTSFINEDLIDYLESDRSQNIYVKITAQTQGSPFYITINDPFSSYCNALEGKEYLFKLESSNLPSSLQHNWQWEESQDNGNSWWPIFGENSTTYLHTVEPYQCGWKYRLSANNSNYCTKVTSNVITTNLPLDPHVYFERNEPVTTSGNIINDIGYEKAFITTSTGNRVSPENLNFQWQIAYFNGFEPDTPGGFLWGGYGFRDWKDILPGSVLQILNNTTTDERFGPFTNSLGTVTTIPGNFQATIAGYHTRTLEWSFRYGTSNEYFSRKYPQLFRLKVSNDCETLYSDTIDPDPITTILFNNRRMPSDSINTLTEFASSKSLLNSYPLLYPNPSNTQTDFTILFTNNEFNYEIYNINAQLITSGSAANSVRVNTSLLSQSMYFIVIKCKGQIYTHKLIIQR